MIHQPYFMKCVQNINLINWQTSYINIQDSIFRNNSALIGSSLTVLPKYYMVFDFAGVAVSILSSTFEDNLSELGRVLCIYNSTLSVINSNFINNNASKTSPQW